MFYSIYLRSCQIAVGMIWKTLEYARNIKTCWLVGRPEGMMSYQVSKFDLIGILWKYLVCFLELIAWRKSVIAERMNYYLQIVFIFNEYLLNPVAQECAFLTRLLRKNDAGMKISKVFLLLFFSLKTVTVNCLQLKMKHTKSWWDTKR